MHSEPIGDRRTPGTYANAGPTGMVGLLTSAGRALVRCMRKALTSSHAGKLVVVAVVAKVEMAFAGEVKASEVEVMVAEAKDSAVLRSTLWQLATAVSFSARPHTCLLE